MKHTTPSKAIRLHCLDCQGTSPAVAKCESKACQLHQLREGPKAGMSRLKAIRSYCVECVGGELSQIAQCTAGPEANGYRCPLWQFRMGKNPALKGKRFAPPKHQVPIGFRKSTQGGLHGSQAIGPLLVAFAMLIPFSVFAANPEQQAAPPVVKPSPGLPAASNPLAEAVARLAADSIAYQDTAGSLSAAQAAVAALAPKATALSQQIVSDMAEIAKLVNVVVPPNPQPSPPVPVGPQVSLLVLSSDACQPCKILEPIVARLATEGLPVAVSKSEADAAKYAIKATPTFVVLVDGKEQARNVGILDEAQIRDWIVRIKEWVAKGGGK